MLLPILGWDSNRAVKKSRISEDEARFYIAEIVDVLEYLHKVGLIHRDVKRIYFLLQMDM